MTDSPEEKIPHSPHAPGPARSSKRPPLMRSDERGIAFLCHTITMVPLWALVANALLHFLYREKSRTVCFHATQGIYFQIVLLLVSVPIFLLLPLENLLKVAQVSFPVVDHLPQIARWLIAGIYLVYLMFCLLGAIQSLRGRIFVYPLVGRSLYLSYLEESFGKTAPKGMGI